MRHQRQRRARHAQNAQHICLQRRLPVRVPAFGDGVQSVRAAGVVDQDVQDLPLCPAFRSPDFGLRPGDERFHAGRFGHVQGVKMRLRRAGLARFGGDFFQAVNAPRAEQEFRAFRAERPGRRRAEAAGRAGDEHPFVFQ